MQHARTRRRRRWLADKLWFIHLWSLDRILDLDGVALGWQCDGSCFLDLVTCVSVAQEGGGGRVARWPSRWPVQCQTQMIQGVLHVWEAERRDRWFGRASRELSVPLTVRVACDLAMDLAAFPHPGRCTCALSE